MRPLGSVLQPVESVGFVAAQPAVVALPADAVVAAGRRHVAGDFLHVAQHRQPTTGPAFELCFSHADLLESGDPTVNNLRQF
jgi:hypothetical protein